jgi:hypothetical protein
MSDSKGFVLFNTPDVERTVRHISEWHKIMKDRGLEQIVKEEIEKLREVYI